MVPKGWEQKKLEELCSLDAPITYGVLKPGEYFCGGIPLLQIKDLCDGSVLSNGLHLISPELDYEYRRSRIIKNDILISLVGTIGRVAKYQSSSEANIHRNIGRIRSNQHEYLFHYLRSDDVQRGITDSASGSSQSALNLSTLRSMLILVPPVIEQKKIAKILSTWDKAISVTEKLLTNSQQQKKALMQQLLTGKKRLLDENGVRFSGEWKRVKLGAIADMNSGGTPKSTVEEYYGGNIPWVSISDMTSNGKWIATTEKYLTELGLNSSSARIYPKNSVLYAMYASIGECSIAAVNLTSSQAILGIRPKDCLNYEFLYFYLTSLKEKIKLQGQQGTQSNLNAGMVKEFELGKVRISRSFLPKLTR
ncbi:restriction endonuclease subunit S [Escherichia coli]|nr:restriction endonuclease subunit S [Escherichia coli]